MMHITDNEELLLDYLYDEAEPSARLKIARHLQECAPCSVAVLELQSVRGLLRDWTPPDTVLGFKVVPAGKEAPVIEQTAELPMVPAPSSGRRSGRWPAWAQAAAAVFLFAAGMAVSQLRFEYGDGALTVRTNNVAPATAAADIIPRSGTDILLPASTRTESANAENVTFAPSRSGSAAADDLLKRVQTLIDQSESRQQRELALRLADVIRDFDMQRQADMLQVQQNFGQLEGQTGAEVAQQRALINSLVKVSQGGSK